VTTDISRLGGGADGVKFCRDLPRQAGVVAIPNAVFYDDPDAGRFQVRFAFCKKPEVLQDALARIEKWAALRG
jgi:N-succinyldiaminopimelate aminotransferase